MLFPLIFPTFGSICQCGICFCHLAWEPRPVLALLSLWSLLLSVFDGLSCWEDTLCWNWGLLLRLCHLPDISLLCHLHLELVRHAESQAPRNLRICLLTKSWVIQMPIRVSGVAWWAPEIQILLRSVFWLGSYTQVGNLFVSYKHGWTQTIHLDGTGCSFSVSLSHCCISLWVQVPSSLPGEPQTGQTPPFPGSTLQNPALQGWSTPPSYVTYLSTHGWQKIKKPGSFVTSLYFLVFCSNNFPGYMAVKQLY